MKHIIYILLFLISFNGVAQRCEGCIDSLKTIINDSKKDTTTVNALTHKRWLYYDNDTAKVLLDEAIELSKSLKDTLLEARVRFRIGVWYYNNTEAEKGLDLCLKTLEVFEEFESKHDMAIANNRIGWMLDFQELKGEAQDYYLVAKDLYGEIGDSVGYADALGNIANGYPDSLFEQAILLEEKACGIYRRRPSSKNERKRAISLGNMANQLISNNVQLKRAIKLIHEANGIWTKAQSYGGVSYNDVRLGIMYVKAGEIDSAIFYLNRCYSYAKEHQWKEQINISYKYLAEAYYKKGNNKLAYEVFRYGTNFHDSIYGNETTEKLVSMSNNYEEEKVQIIKENEAKEVARVLAEATGRRDNIQYSLIFLGILVLFVGIMMLGFIKVSPSIAEGIIFFAFLILFEFVLVFTEPYMEQYTNGEPMYNLLANSVLALLIFPLHAILEKLLKKRIVKV
jgi:tetratricopeptide (TPR) repeat protein